MNFKYYHGTSTIFLESIKEKGLGGINPNIDFKNLDVLRFLYAQAESLLYNNPNYLTLRDTTKAMALQRDNKYWVDELGVEVVHNYKHSGVYVGLDIIRAVIYASTNKYGSEILERCIVLYQMLLERNPKFKISDEINLFQIEKYVGGHFKPIVVEVLNVNDDDLETEDGEDTKELFHYLRNVLPYRSPKERFEFPQMCNFRLLKAVPPENLRFYELEYEGKPTHQISFEWTLNEI